jgi:hypothetical protein
MQIEEMVTQLSTVGKRKTPSMVWESVLYYYASIMMNKYNLRKQIGSKPYIRYYSIVFSQSGSGKSYLLNKIENMCHLDNYGKIMASSFQQNIDHLPERPDDIDEVLRYMPKSVTIGLEGTSEGLFYVAMSQASSFFGSLNLQTDELRIIY